MRYMLLVYSPENGWTPEEWHQCTVDSSAVCNELAADGKFEMASPLQPVALATSVRVRDGKRLVTDGPFAETTEQLGGFYIINVANLDEAIAIASRIPPAKKGTIEIRPIYELPASVTADECAIVSSREFPFPRQALFDAMADPERLARWWGPAGFRNTFETFSFEPGGEWRFVMHGPDGVDYPNECVFADITPLERVVFDHVSEPKFRMTMTLAELGLARTKLTWRMRFTTSSIRSRVEGVVIPSNEQNFDRLFQELSNA